MASILSPTHAIFLAPSRRDPPVRAAHELPIQQPPLQQQQPSPEQETFDDNYQALFCKAMYDYVAQDASALSFRRGDIIEVLNQQPSGWWDGLLGDERGWFPSNYVVPISLEEAEMAFSGSDYSIGDGVAQSDSDTGVLDMSDVMMRGQTQNEEWPESDITYTNRYVNNGNAAAPQGSQTNDFWEPNLTEDGRIYYVNSRTGERSSDLPQETTDEISESELAGLSAQNTVRAATGAGMAFGAAATINGINGTHTSEPAGFGVPRSTGTPEPWIKRLADDGQSYYYINKQTGKTVWTRPEATATNDSHSDLEDSAPPSTAQPLASRSSVYSDDSDIHPLDYPHAPRTIDPFHQLPTQAQTIQPNTTVGGVQLTSEEVIAKQLQQVLAPPPSEVVTDLSSKAQDAIQAIMDTVRGTVGRAGDDQRMDDLIQAAVRAVRNLLYVSAVNTSHMPTDLLVRESRERSSSSSSPLKPAQRRVTATLSRLVLSARAMYYDSGSHISETLTRIEADALELERAVGSFIAEVQRCQRDNHKDGKTSKRLYGAFATANIGAGLVGAGSAGTWKGFGWVSQEVEEQAPQKHLNQDVVAEVLVMLENVEDLFALLSQALMSSADSSVEQIRQRVQDLIAHVSHFLTFVADIHVARHVDIDGFRQAGDNVDDMYAQTLARARAFVRTLETAVQAVYDDSSSLLLTTQVIPSPDFNYPADERAAAFHLLESIGSSLRVNLALVRETLEGLLAVGHEQADIAQGDYNGSIEWRMSRLSVVHSQFGGNGRMSQEFESALDLEQEDVVDFDHVFSRPTPPAKVPRPSIEQSVDSLSTLHESSEHVNGSTEGSYATGGSTLPPDPTEENFDAEVYTIDEELEPAKPKKPTRPGPGKLISLLGNEYADKVAAESQPWFLRSNFNPSEIIIDEADNSVKAGTVPALVEKLTAHDQVDLPYARAFLMTYKDFTTLDELFDLLVQRFRLQPPENLTPKELENWTKLKQHIVRNRVLNTFRTMITEQYVLDKEDMYILARIKDFISQEDVGVMPAAKALRSLIERAQTNGDTAIQSFVTTNQIPAPTPILPKNSKKLKLLDIDPLELARQLTIMESRMYQRIKPIEALGRARAQKMDVTDNIGAVIQTSNRIADWVAHSILSKEDSRRRAQVVKYLINVADRCRTLNNFSSMIAITSGLNTPPIRRLKRTWEQVNQRVIAQFAACEVTIDSSKTFAKYRQLMSSVTPPCVPFIGVFLSTLQFTVDGNADNLPGNLVNFFKRQKASEVMDDIKRWQATPYNLTPVPSVLNFIDDSLNQFSNTDTRASSDIFWKLSLEREPREREDEKMARLLQESGFL
ncbi:ras GEF [Macrolepiota fuliginosa MF-IS2]|uniref:Ras GEF n=1 Tax=Macrolepiota fuliginosa MF-IS2 TaxID=1400762 RepID=A0A9P5XSY6_9AGAR|nr:ras GEF [Macrolepiota fuliginosa MF-IS2]